MSQTRTASVIGILAILAGLMFVGLHTTVIHRYHHRSHTTSEYEPFGAGDMAVDFTLKDLNGNDVSLSRLRGKVVFLNIWATWCAPCLEEMPSMETLYDEFKDHSDFVILAVSQDEKGRDVVLPYVSKNGYRFLILLDPDNKLTQEYELSGVPETFIIDRQGRIVAHHMGAFDWSREDVKSALRDLLDGHPG